MHQHRRTTIASLLHAAPPPSTSLGPRGRAVVLALNEEEKIGRTLEVEARRHWRVGARTVELGVLQWQQGRGIQLPPDGA